MATIRNQQVGGSTRLDPLFFPRALSTTPESVWHTAMLRTKFVTLACIVVVRCSSPPTEAQRATSHNSAAPPSLEQEIAGIVPALLEEYNIPGASVAVIVDGEVALARGFGVLRAGEESPVNERTVFQAASLSKPVVAYGVHLLAQEGRIDLDRPLSEYMDAPYVDDSRIIRITARVALSHTTGFPNWRPKRWTDNPAPLEIEFDPGSRFQHSGEGYVYLQRVVERVTGESLDVYLRRAVLEPLGMSDSSFVWEERFEAVHASPHDGEGLPQEKWRPREALAAGTLHTTAADYARFLQAVVTDSSDGPLRSDAIDLMLEPHSTIDDELGWALGWGIERAEDGTAFWQWGDDETFKALTAGSRSRRAAVVVLTNGQWGRNVARPIMELSLGPRRFLDFRMVNYRP